MTVAAIDKLAAGTISMTALLPSLFTNDLTTPVLGVGVTTVAGAVLGTYGAIGYDEKQRPRGKLFTLALSTVILASMLVGVLPRALGWNWSSGGVEGGLAGLTAVILYYLLPPTLKRAGELIRSFTWADLLPFLKRHQPPDPPPPAAPPGGEGPPDK